MSFPYSQDARRRRVGAAGAGFSSTGRRTFLGYYVPLALTVSVAAIGVAAWIWSERSEDDDDERDYPGDGDDVPAPAPGGAYAGDYARSTATDLHGDMQDDPGMMARMQGALRRTPSPQQIFDGASKRVAAGMAAAGAFVGGALTSIREERGDFEDHSRWSEEVESRAARRDLPDPAVPTMSGALPSRGVAGAPSLDKKKKTVAIVVSSESLHVGPDELTSDHVSILSHLPEHIDPDTCKIFVMIYAPGLKHAPNHGNGSQPTPSVTSSYSNIAPEEAADDLDTPDSSRHASEPEGATPLFNTLYTQAQAIVDKKNTIMPFSTATGYVHLVRHISPEIVYVQESLTGKDGEPVHHISRWVRQVVVVVGDRGGLIDSEDESALADHGEKWWQKEGTTGIGKRIDVVDELRIGDDWRRRVSGHD
ncbi:peroxin-22-like protein Pex22-like-penicillium chrysogenum [Aspergillus terreus]|uniref:Peroxin-22-like protein Pex22-like-penicillium chrysogenum n=1 Tax=Aspergillus terreus TaxID=33178 RepID=A0A5M3Z1T1_ASPTE|nr:hypothetical protein ATETN484_0007021000 [Aspergillus terreus]GFF16015.1 peroxin-22-like protein Pex22-like-penicillium chrysogenum [Aspergillus terreus]